MSVRDSAFEFQISKLLKMFEHKFTTKLTDFCIENTNMFANQLEQNTPFVCCMIHMMIGVLLFPE